MLNTSLELSEEERVIVEAAAVLTNGKNVAAVTRVTVMFQDASGNQLTSRQFSPGQSLRIVVNAKDITGLPSWNAPVVLDISNDSGNLVYMTGRTSFMGNVTFEFTLPNITTKATVTVTVSYLIGADQVATIPIGIGTSPEPLPSTKTTNWLLIGGLAIGGALVVTIVARQFFK